MSKKKVLIADRFAQDSFLYLQREPNLELFRSDSPTHLPQEHLVSAHALVIRSKTQITEDLLKKARQLQVIITCTSGFDHIDLEATQKWGITVMHTPTANVESASQLTMMLILACAHRLNQAKNMTRTQDWNRNLIIGTELAGRTLGIVGLGRIGQRVAQLANAFQMEIIAFDPYQDEDVFTKHKAERKSYEELLKLSDFITFHVPKTLETDYMLNKSHFEYINRGCVLINTSRGSVVKEHDLIEALENRHLTAAGLDVFEKEPLAKDHRLFKFDNVITTPHIGANTEAAFYKASRIAAEKLVRFFTDSTTSDVLPPKVPWYGATPFKSE